MNIIQRRPYISPSGYEDGKTTLTPEQLTIFLSISDALHENYYSFLNQYSPKGIISILYAQLETKRINESVPPRDIKIAERDIQLLGHSFGFLL